MQLPKPIDDLVRASSNSDMEQFLDTWADDALLVDSHRQYWGKEAIRRWSSIEWIGDYVKFTDIRSVKKHHDELIVDAGLAGIYDTQGLPSDYVIRFHFKLRNDRIARLIILPCNGRRLGKMTQTRMASTCFSAPAPLPQ
jgi:hypothetical protein